MHLLLSPRRAWLAAAAANAEETRIGVGVGPVGAGVTVGQSPSYEWQAYAAIALSGS